MRNKLSRKFIIPISAILIVAFFSRPLHAQISFKVYEMGDWGNKMGQTSLVDVDNDGDLDFLSGTRGGNPYVVSMQRRGKSARSMLTRYLLSETGEPTGKREVLYTWTNADIMAMGLAFSPESTPSDMTAYVSLNAKYKSDNDGGTTNPWGGSIALVTISGSDVKVRDVAVNLPVGFHGINDLAFGPDNKLYSCAGSTATSGGAGVHSAEHPEKLLSAAILQLALKKLNGVLNAKTSSGGRYNPYAADAPLKLFATAIRQPWDCVWHPNGLLYMCSNQNDVNGRTGGGSGVPDLKNVKPSQESKARFSQLQADDRSILDSLREDTAALNRRLGRRDQAKLDEYLTNLWSVERRIARAEKWLDVPRYAVDDNQAQKFQAGDRYDYDLLMELIYLAFISDTTRCIAFDQMTEPGLCHGTSHWHSDPENKLPEMDTWDRKWLTGLTTLVGRRKSAQEGDGTMLDQTAIVYGGGHGRRPHYSHDLPMLLVGGGSLGFKHGQHLAFAPLVDEATDRAQPTGPLPG